MNMGVLRLLLLGPGFVLILTSVLAATALLAGTCGRLQPFAASVARAARRLSSGRAMLLLWGLSAFALTLLAAAILVNIKPLALLGVVVFVLGLMLAGLGLGVSAAYGGRSLLRALGGTSFSPLSGLGLGLTALFLASLVPFVGWLLVLCAVLTGIGAVLDTLLRHLPRGG